MDRHSFEQSYLICRDIPSLITALVLVDSRDN